MANNAKGCGTCGSPIQPSKVELQVAGQILNNIKLENLSFNDGVFKVKEPTIKVNTDDIK